MTTNPKVTKWLAVQAMGDTVRLVPQEGHGPDFFVKLTDYEEQQSEVERLTAELADKLADMADKEARNVRLSSGIVKAYAAIEAIKDVLASYEKDSAPRCQHSWTVLGAPRDPNPDQGCDHCGLRWKDRLSVSETPEHG